MSTKEKTLKRKFAFLNKIFWIGFYSKHWINYINNKKINLFMSTIGNEAQSLIEKYKDTVVPSSPIGNRVWVFWYTGLETAPSIVKKCIEEMKKVEEIDLVVLDKNNLDNYFNWNEDIKKRFTDGTISVTFLSDVIRNQLLSRFGGFWFDATLLIIDKSFLKEHMNDNFYSLKHGDYAACSHFNNGMWSSFLTGAPKNHPLTSFAYEFFCWYCSKYESLVDYFLIDYVYMLAYLSFDQVKTQIDSLEAENEDVFYMGRNIHKKCTAVKWEQVLYKNKLQKLIWNVKGAEKLGKESFYSRILAYNGEEND